jgi:hypothetical protein
LGSIMFRSRGISKIPFLKRLAGQGPKTQVQVVE